MSHQEESGQSTLQKHDHESWIARKIARFGELSQSPEGRKLLRRKISTFFNRLLLITIIGYAVFIISLVASMHWIGERNVTTAFLLYLPPAIWLLPAPVLAFLALLIRKRHVFTVIGISALAFLALFNYQLGEDPILHAADRPADTITVLTYNRGQNNRQSLQPFKNLTQPDLLVLQDSGNRADNFMRSDGYSEFSHAESIANFTLVSKFPIRSKEAFSQQHGKRERYYAARFVIDFNGKAVSVYAVHLPTPRDMLLHYRKGSFLVGVLGFPGSPFASSRKKYQQFWDVHINMTKELLEKTQADPNPVIVAGDFNAPSLGYIHKLVADQLTDAHEEVGHGTGHSFPGVTRNPLSLFGPWMRIDYLFCNDMFQPKWCLTEEKRPSQHRAITASFKLTTD